MARTWHHGDKAKERLFGCNRSIWVGTALERNQGPKKKRWEQEWDWMREPGLWHHMHCEIKTRRDGRDAIQHYLRGETEDVVLRNWKRPHIYYW